MKLDLQNILALGSEGLTPQELQKESGKIAEFLSGFDARDQGFPFA